METTQPDPVVAEVRAVRDRFAARAGYDADTIFRQIREMQEASDREYVTYPARRIAEGTDESPAV